MEKGFLVVNEISETISGEVGYIRQGCPITLVRLQGCNMSCPWCDATSSITDEGGMRLDVKTLARFLTSSYVPVLITGGEPILQKDGIIALIKYMEDHDIKRPIQIETNGTCILPTELFGKVSFVVDYKMAYPELMDREQLSFLSEKDWVKIVINRLDQIDLLPQTMDLIAGGFGECRPKLAVTTTNKDLYLEITKMILDKQLPIVVNVQLHKFLRVQ